MTEGDREETVVLYSSCGCHRGDPVSTLGLEEAPTRWHSPANPQRVKSRRFYIETPTSGISHMALPAYSFSKPWPQYWRPMNIHWDCVKVNRKVTIAGFVFYSLNSNTSQAPNSCIKSPKTVRIPQRNK